MLKWFKKIDIFLDQHIPILLLLAFMLLLRIPNLVEPYWYGDEAIYLTIGHAMSQGERLYSQIIDHKTPIIYYLAMVPTQFWFRVLNIGAMTLSTIIFYTLSKKLFSRNWIAYVASFIFVILTTLPALEGNIPNGELFVMTFILLGAACLMRTQFLNQFLESEKKIPGPELAKRSTEQLWLFLAGSFFGLGILTKVPGLFDVLAFLSVGWFSLLRALPVFDRYKQNRTWMVNAKESLLSTVVISAGILFPILLSILYFVMRGSGKAYLDYGLLYNFRYAGSWKLEFANPLLTFAFTLTGKALLAGGVIGILSLSSRYIRHKFQFVATWFCLAFFATLLSNRPYPHYFLQMVPPFALLIGEILGFYKSMTMLRKVKQAAVDHFEMGIEIFVSAALLFLFVSGLLLLNVRPYETLGYYGNFYKLFAGKMTPIQYRDSFNTLMPDNYAAAKIISAAPDDHLFIWGTDPGLYALAKKSPVGRFTVLFHIRDFNAEHETYLDLVRTKPIYAVMIKNEIVPSEIKEYLDSNYIPNLTFEHFVLWKKTPS